MRNRNEKLVYGNIQSDGSRRVYRMTDAGRVCCGVLMPTVKNPGIAVQTWSRAGKDSGLNVELFDPASVANFSDYFVAVYGRTYPLADVTEAQRRNHTATVRIVPDISPARIAIESPEAREKLISEIFGNKSKRVDGNPARFINLTGDDFSS